MFDLFEWGVAASAACVAFEAAWLRLTHQFQTDTEIWPYGNPSMGGTFISIALVGTAYEPMAWLAALCLGRSTPLLVLGVYRLLKHFSWGALGIAAAATLLAFLFFGVPTGTGRFELWSFYLHWWWGLPAHFHWVGIGIGQTAVYLPRVQFFDAIKRNLSLNQPYFMVAHNDFLQALVEVGILGFTALAGIAVFLFYRASKEQRLKGASLIAAMATNFPWHAMPHMFVYWLWIREVLCRLNRKRSERNLQS